MPKIIARRKEFLAGDAKLWSVLIGVDRYLDARITDLSYSAIDCQNLAKNLETATQHFQDKQVVIYHDFNEQESQLPYLENVIKSLELLKNAKENDTVIFYFSGHTYLEEKTQKPIFCLRDTQTEVISESKEFTIIPETGLKVEDLLRKYLADCQAQQQIVLLDSCHSGGLSYKELATKGDSIENKKGDNTASELINILQKKARNSQGFYGILSCDKQEKSLELPQLKHGLFTYFLIKGLAGEAADEEGIISADRLYRYVYYSTLEYIDKSNQFIRFYNQQQRGQSTTDKQRKEIPLQTPRRIVEGSGEFLIGLSPIKKLEQSRRVGLVINGLNLHQSAIDLCRILKSKGKFELLPFLDRYENIKENLEECLSSETTQTILIYLSGRVEQTKEGTNLLRLGDNNRLSRDWFLEKLKDSPIPQKIVILNCPEAENISKWVKTLQLGMEAQECIIAAAPREELVTEFNQILVKVLSESTTGLTATEAISQIQKQLHYFRESSSVEIELFTWISGDYGIIDLVLPTQKNSVVFDAGICPYKGLEAFTKQDAFFYYGRENLRREILNKLENTSFLAVVGASGSGKSSLVQAGVLPVIDRKGIYCDEQKIIKQCQSISFQPGTNPIQSLAAVLAPLGIYSQKKEAESIDYLQEILFSKTENGLVRYLRSLAIETVVINIDQFEELFTLAVESERNRFINLIIDAIAVAADKLKVIITLRGDFIFSCLSFPQLSDLVKNNNVLVPSILSESEYREIITQPAQKVGLSVEASLVNRLIEQLDNTSGTLPILQYILSQLWRDRALGKLSLEIYESKIGGLKTALEQKADQLYNSLNKGQKECARCIFLALVQISVDGKYSRRRVFKSDLFTAKYPAELIESTLEKIIDSKLVVTGIKTTNSEGISSKQVGTYRDTSLQNYPSYLNLEDKNIGNLVTVEITHEILISNWNRLLEWLDRDRSFQIWRQQLSQSLDKWLDNQRDFGALLTGLQLSEAQGWFQSRFDDLTANEIEYIRASTAFKELEQKEKEEQKERELAQEKKARQYAQIGIAVSLVITSIATGLGFMANTQRLKADRQTKIANLQVKAMKTQNLLFTNPAEALVTAMAALRVSNQFGLEKDLSILKPNLSEAVYATQEKLKINGHSNSVNSVAFSPDGEKIASASSDNTVRMWDISGNELAVFKGHKGSVYSVAFSPDGEKIASASSDNTVRLWDISGNELAVFKGHKGSVNSVAFSPDGEKIASASQDGMVRVWDLSGKELAVFKGHTREVISVAFSPDGEKIASASSDNTVRVWNISGNELAVFKGHNNWVRSVAFSPDGETIASASLDNTVRVWDLSGKELAVFKGHTDLVMSVAFSPDGEKIASASFDNTVRVWDLSGNELAVFQGHADSVSSVQFSPDGETIASASLDNTVRVWDISGNELAVFKGHADSVSSVQFSPDGETIASASLDNTVRVWDISGKEIAVFQGHADSVSSVQFSPDGETIASASLDNTVRVWDISGNELAVFKGHTREVISVAFSPDGKTIASASDDRTVQLWDISGNELAVFKGHTSWVSSVAFSPDGKTIASASFDNMVRVWDISGKELAVFQGHTNRVMSVAFSSDGEKIASASSDNTVRVWDISGNELAVFQGHTNSVMSVAFSPDGEKIASASSDNTVRVWDISGNELAVFKGHTNAVTSVQFSPDGEKIASASRDNTVRVWLFNWQDLLTLACDRLRYHSLLLEAKTEDARAAGEACLEYSKWDDNQKALFQRALRSRSLHRSRFNYSQTWQLQTSCQGVKRS